MSGMCKDIPFPFSETTKPISCTSFQGVNNAPAIRIAVRRELDGVCTLHIHKRLWYFHKATARSKITQYQRTPGGDCVAAELVTMASTVVFLVAILVCSCPAFGEWCEYYIVIFILFRAHYVIAKSMQCARSLLPSKGWLDKTVVFIIVFQCKPTFASSTKPVLTKCILTTLVAHGTDKS